VTSEPPSGLHVPFQTLSNLLMREKFAVLQSLFPTIYGLGEPALLVKIPLHNVLHEFIGISTQLSRGASELRFKFRGEMDLHAYRLRENSQSGNRTQLNQSSKS
jgi:hypothetical protein